VAASRFMRNGSRNQRADRSCRKDGQFHVVPPGTERTKETLLWAESQ
jgi:hypothetical protein